ncbi:hypothetical protein L3X38_038575 [Prunus dulcis]|uniref:Uncharacterized protein n=1 Tax=Prunus dulcis TaxID=3755 RepID=A0AAD4V743_PRUDU|nr:hypothetical protein L3X38_038575 [Prunus dulcis]
MREKYWQSWLAENVEDECLGRQNWTCDNNSMRCDLSFHISGIQVPEKKNSLEFDNNSLELYGLSCYIFGIPGWADSDSWSLKKTLVQNRLDY